MCSYVDTMPIGLILITVSLSLVADPIYIPGDVSFQLGKWSDFWLWNTGYLAFYLFFFAILLCSTLPSATLYPTLKKCSSISLEKKRTELSKKWPVFLLQGQMFKSNILAVKKKNNTFNVITAGTVLCSSSIHFLFNKCQHLGCISEYLSHNSQCFIASYLQSLPCSDQIQMMNKFHVILFV